MASWSLTLQNKISNGSHNRETQSTQLISLIQELAAANNKLKGEILNQQETISSLSTRVQEAEIDHKVDLDHNLDQDHSFAIPVSTHHRGQSSDQSSQISGSWSSSILATSPPRNIIKSYDDAATQPSQPTSLLSKLEEAASMAQSSPRKHNTYNKYEGSPLGIEVPAGVAIVKPERSVSAPMKTKFGSPLSQTSAFMTPSPPQSPNLAGQELRHPYKLLHDLATHLFKRLSGTEIRVLNRRLHRAFDMLKLTDLSNSIIDNVNQDIQALDSRFAWVQQGVKDQEQAWSQETIALSSFFVTVKLVQDLLAEIGVLRTTLNSLQVEYVNKVNENQSFVEKALEEQAESSKPVDKQPENAGAFAWLSSMIYRTSGGGGSNASVKNSDDDSAHTAGTDDTSEGGGNVSSISYWSNSIYRIANNLQGGAGAGGNNSS